MSTALTPPATTPLTPSGAELDDSGTGRFAVVVIAAELETEGGSPIANGVAIAQTLELMGPHARGLICLCLTPERCRELGLRQMTEQNETPNRTAFTVTIEAREGISTGISAHDRARTIQAAIDPASGPHDLVQPGHVFPLEA